jgi:hypothetical protein
MFILPCYPACACEHAEVVAILEGTGVRRAKVVSGGAVIEVATIGGAEIHLGDRILLDLPLGLDKRCLNRLAIEQTHDVPEDEM